MAPHPRLAVLAALAALVAAPSVPAKQLQGGRPLDPPAGALVAPGPAPAMFLVSSGDVIGYIEDCGCKLNPAGGLARRTWLHERLRTNYPDVPIVGLDSGGYSDNPSEAGEKRTRALLEGMVKLGYRVVNLAERDLSLGYAAFEESSKGLSLSFISTNIVKQGTTEPVFPPYEIVEVDTPAGKVRVGVLGVVRYSPVWQKAGPPGTNLATAPPALMVKRYLPEVRAKSDVVVLLAAVHRDDAGEIARTLPGIDFVFGAYGGVYNAFEEREGPTEILYTGNQGKRVGETRVFLGSDRKVASSESYLHFLTSRYPDDSDMRAWVDAKKAEIGSP